MRQPYSTEFVSACEVWIEVRIGVAINRSTILRKQQCFRYQRVPRCVLGNFCGVVSTAEGPRGRFTPPHLHLSCTEVGAGPIKVGR